jgi:hypothetical protein
MKSFLELHDAFMCCSNSEVNWIFFRIAWIPEMMERGESGVLVDWFSTAVEKDKLPRQNSPSFLQVPNNC